MPGPGLLATVTVATFADHLPIYQLEAIFAHCRVDKIVDAPECRPEHEAMSRVIYRQELPAGAAYVQQQALRSRPGEYHSLHPRVEASLRWALGELPQGYLQGKSVIDAATRDGYAIDVLRTFSPSFAEGIELVPNTAARARKRGRAVRQGDMAELPYSDGTIDLVTCMHALEHAPNPGQVVREFARVLRPGGALFVVVPRDARPEADTCHNCAFPTIDALIRLVTESEYYDVMSIRQSVGKLPRGKRELRLLIMKNWP